MSIPPFRSLFRSPFASAFYNGDAVDGSLWRIRATSVGFSIFPAVETFPDISGNAGPSAIQSTGAQQGVLVLDTNPYVLCDNSDDNYTIQLADGAGFLAGQSAGFTMTYVFWVEGTGTTILNRDNISVAPFVRWDIYATVDGSLFCRFVNESGVQVSANSGAGTVSAMTPTVVTMHFASVDGKLRTYVNGALTATSTGTGVSVLSSATASTTFQIRQVFAGMGQTRIYDIAQHEAHTVAEGVAIHDMIRAEYGI